MGSMDSACLFLGVQNSESAEPVVDVERTVYYRERAAGMYSAAAYAFAQAFRANNVESAKSRLNLCAKDIREQLGRLGNTSELCSQLGAVLGMLGYCCRATGDASSAVSHFKESVNFLSKVSSDDLESPWWFVMVIILLNEKTTKASSVKPPKAEECDEGEDDDGDLKGVL